MKEKEEKYYNRIKSSLIGHRINDLFYEELDYQDSNEYWNLSQSIHSVDMNIIFKLENNELIQLFWDNEFCCYGIGLEKIESIYSKENIKTINLKSNENWSKVLEKKIRHISVLWEIEENIKEQHYKNNKLSSSNLGNPI